MRIRFFNLTDTAAPCVRDLAPALAARGHEVEIVVSAARYRGRSDLANLAQDHPGIRILRMPSLGLPRNAPFLIRMFTMATYAVQAAALAIFGPRADRNVFLTQPPLFGVVGALAKLLRGQPYYWILMDRYPQIAVALGVLRPGSLPTRLLERIGDLGMRSADGLFVIGRCMEESLEELAPGRIHFIPNWADDAAIVPVAHDANRLRQAASWRDRFVVMYAGNLGRPQRFQTLLEAAERLRGDPRVHFVVIGEGAHRALLEREVRARDLANLSLYPFLHEEYSLADIHGAGDLHFVSLRPECHALAVPSKTYGAFAAGRPILYEGDPAGEIARLAREHEVGSVVEPRDVEAMVAAIRGYLDDPGRAADEGARALELATGPLHRDRSVGRYVEILEGSVTSGEAGAGPCGSSG